MSLIENLVSSDSQDNVIYESKLAALIRLNTYVFSINDLVTLKYYNASGILDYLVAQGIKNGLGSDCYIILFDHKEIQIYDFFTSMPDISILVSGFIYIYTDQETKKSYYIERNGNKKNITEIKEDITVRSLKNSQEYYIKLGYNPINIYESLIKLSDTNSLESRIKTLEEEKNRIEVSGTTLKIRTK